MRYTLAIAVNYVAVVVSIVNSYKKLNGSTAEGGLAGRRTNITCQFQGCGGSISSSNYRIAFIPISNCTALELGRLNKFP